MPQLPGPQTRSVRLDAEAERALAEIQRRTGDSISDALKRGLLAAVRELRGAPGVRAWQVYERLDLGSGGYAKAPARDAKRRMGELLRDTPRR